MGEVLQSLFQNPGLDHIAIQIHSYLDYQSLDNCQLASKTWNNFLQENNVIWREQIKHLEFGIIKNSFEFQQLQADHRNPETSIFERYDPETNTYVLFEFIKENEDILFLSKFPEWRQIFKYIESKPFREIKLFLKHMAQYLSIDWNDKKQDIKNLIGFNSPYSPVFYHIMLEEGEINFIKLVLTGPFEISKDVHDCIPEQYRTEDWLYYIFDKGDNLIEHISTVQYWASGRTHFDDLLKLTIYYAHFNQMVIDDHDIDSTYLTPFQIAWVYYEPELINLFLDYPSKGFDINEFSENGDTLLHLFIKNETVWTIDEGFEPEIDKMKELLNIGPKHGLNINAKNRDGVSVLHYAWTHGVIEAVTLLLEQPNINVNAMDDHGFTLLHLAAQKGDLHMIEMLSKISSINVNARTNNGETLLHIACKSQQIEFIKSICDLLPDLDNLIEDSSGKRALQYVNKEKIENTLNEYNRKMNDNVQSETKVKHARLK